MKLKNRIKSELKKIPYFESMVKSLKRNSYKEIDHHAAKSAIKKLSDSWKDSKIPERQWSLVQEQLTSYKAGQPINVFDALVDVLVNNVPSLEDKKIIEIGCSSGYYSEVLRIKGIESSYRGCDYSEAFISQAQKQFPETEFDVEDATRLNYESKSFDVVISGCCILHIYSYEQAIKEAIRVSKKYVVFHRTPVLHLRGPVFYIKKGYGQKMFEIHFNEQKLVRFFSEQGLRIIDVNTQSLSWNKKHNDALAMKTYLCEKMC